MSFLSQMPFNWFDVVVLVVLFTGISRGRKRGMSEELMPLLKWLLLILGCAVAYQPIGSMIAQSSQVFTPLTAYLVAYCGTALVIAIGFALVTKMMGGKLVGSDIFGRNEYYLGMIAGTLRFTCVLIAVLAVMNARRYRAYEIKDEEKYQKDVYGSNFFPTFQTLQAQVFERSFLGPTIRSQLGFLLIAPTEPEKKPLKRKQIDLP
jgi:uncharacterized membrane protein required for colicin V production